MMNNIDIDKIIIAIDNDIESQSAKLNDLRSKALLAGKALYKEVKKIDKALIELNIKRKIRLVTDIYIASNYELRYREIESLLKSANAENKNIPVVSKSAIGRYLTSDYVASYYGTDVYNKILTFAKEKQEAGRIKGGNNFANFYDVIQDETGLFSGVKEK